MGELRLTEAQNDGHFTTHVGDAVILTLSEAPSTAIGGQPLVRVYRGILATVFLLLWVPQASSQNYSSSITASSELPPTLLT